MIRVKTPGKILRLTESIHQPTAEAWIEELRAEEKVAQAERIKDPGAAFHYGPVRTGPAFMA